MSSKQINTGELDFTEIKNNLKSFLQGQEQFQDYDFEGSSLSVLMDLLAYNTHYNAIYKNLAINEVFLDSATKRSSVVSRAKDLGYVTSSAKAPRAKINLVVTNTSSTPLALTLSKYTPFSTYIDNQQYTFYTSADVSVGYTDSQYTFTDLEIIEGTPLSYTFVVSNFSTYTIPNPNIDLSTLKVSVKENSGSLESTPYTRAENIVGLTNTSLIYFIKEIDDELYELEFGDGILGKALEVGNVISIEYFATNKTAANKAKTFTYQGSTILNGTVSITTTQIADGGSDIEDIELVRFRAPKYYAAQNRVVNTDDYSVILRKEVSTIQAINTWGGEDNVPPVYGKVFICIKPQGTDVLSSAEKDRIIREIIKPKKIAGITPEIVDPNYINLEVNSTIYYNPNKTTRSETDINTLILETIQDYNTANLAQFGSGFRMSQLSSLIDSADTAIISNVTTILLHVPVVPLYSINHNYIIKLFNPIYNDIEGGNVFSNQFLISGSSLNYYIRDDGAGKLQLISVVDNVETIVSSSFGTVDYINGTINISILNISALVNSTFEFTIKPQSYDVMSVRNQIVQIPDSLINVTTIVDSISTGIGSTNHIFTSSRS